MPKFNVFAKCRRTVTQHIEFTIEVIADNSEHARRITHKLTENDLVASCVDIDISREIKDPFLFQDIDITEMSDDDL